MCNFANSILQDDHLSKDVVQDVFFQCWKKRKRLEANSKIKSYLFTSVKNKALEKIRRNKMFSRHESSVLQHALMQRNIEDESEKYVRLEQIHSAIHSLPEKCRQVFLMSKINGLSYAEIAEYLGISVKTVENQIVRGLKLIREKLIK